MFWLPGQSRDSWSRSVARAIDLGPEHLSLYLLELYPNAPLREAMARVATGVATGAGGAQVSADEWRQVADDEAADMYLDAFQRLENAGYGQYEISNASKPGFASRHNLKYWTSGSWRGFGCGAHSTVEGRRWQNLSSTSEYVARVEQGLPVGQNEHVLSDTERIEEALFTGLRLTSGIDCREFRQRFGLDPWVTYVDVLAAPLEADLVWRSDNAFGLTRQGMLVSNEIGQLLI